MCWYQKYIFVSIHFQILTWLFLFSILHLFVLSLFSATWLRIRVVDSIKILSNQLRKIDVAFLCLGVNLGRVLRVDRWCGIMRRRLLFALVLIDSNDVWIDSSCILSLCIVSGLLWLLLGRALWCSNNYRRIFLIIVTILWFRLRLLRVLWSIFASFYGGGLSRLLCISLFRDIQFNLVLPLRLPWCLNFGWLLLTFSRIFFGLSHQRINLNGCIFG